MTALPCSSAPKRPLTTAGFITAAFDKYLLSGQETTRWVLPFQGRGVGEGILLPPPRQGAGIQPGAGMPLLSPGGSGGLLQPSGVKLPVPPSPGRELAGPAGIIPAAGGGLSWLCQSRRKVKVWKTLLGLCEFIPAGLGVRFLSPVFLQQDREAVWMGLQKLMCLSEVLEVEAAETVVGWTKVLLPFGVASPRDG